MTATPCYIARRPRVAARLVGDEMMVMSGRDSTLFSLNPTATLLWQAADGITPLDQIVERDICATFDVNAATALQDAEALVADLARHGILVASPTPVPSISSDSRSGAIARPPVEGGEEG